MQVKQFISQDIAVIGMGIRVPDAENAQEFWTNLEMSRSSIKPFPEQRIKELEAVSSGDIAGHFKMAGYLENVMLFEPELFSISQEESKYIDPQERLLLELVEEAILDAGYNPEALAGSDVAVFIGNMENLYTKQLNSNSPAAFLNSLNSSCVSRITYAYNFTGAAAVVGTACSSSLVAVHEACKCLRLGESKIALAGCTGLQLLPPENSGENTGIESEIKAFDYKVKAFDKDADGFVAGEGGGVVVLKRLEDALADGDNIHAVIKGSAVNSNGRRSNGISAPSEDGQADVILKAIENAYIAPKAISYIETHGTGTKLGDPIEVAGISKALEQIGYLKQSVAIGSLKTNIGHLGNAAGIASIVKTILMLKNKKIPASLNFNQPNPLIDFKNSSVYVNHKLSPWESDGLRCAGVTSLGMTGINCHIVMEEAPEIYSKPESRRRHVVTISARTKASLLQTGRKLKEYLTRHPELDLEHVAYTLNCGRRKGKYRFSCLVQSMEEFHQQLGGLDYSQEITMDKKITTAVFIIPGIQDAVTLVDDQVWKEFSFLKGIFKDTLDKSDNNEEKDYVKNIYIYYKILELVSVKPKAMVGIGTGNAVVEFLNGKISFDRCVEKVRNYEKKAVTEESKFRLYLDRIKSEGFDTFILFGPDSRLEHLFTQYITNNDSINGISSGKTLDGFYKSMLALVKIGMDIQWEGLYKHFNPRRVSLPGCVFDRKSYFSVPEKKIVPLQMKKDTVEVIPERLNQEELLSKIEKMFFSVCNTENPDSHLNIYDLEVDSLGIMQFIAGIQKDYNTKIPAGVFYQGNQLKSIFQDIIRQIMESKEATNIIEKQPQRPYYQVTPMQKRMFLIQNMYPDTVAYNITNVFTVEGDLKREEMQDVFTKLIQRHESLRTSFVMGENGVLQRIHEEVDFEIEFLEAGEDTIHKILKEFIRPFDLSEAPLLRAALVKQEDRKYILMMDMHHIISDGTSLNILARDMASLFQHKELPLLRVQYKDFSAWHNRMMTSGKMDKASGYWLNLFEGEIPVLSLPTDFERPLVKSFEGDSISIWVEKDLSARINRFCETAGASLFMTLMSAYTVLLSKISGQNDIVIGTSIAGRSHPDVTDVVGMFVNTLPIRNRIEKDMTIKNVVEQVKKNCLSAYDHQEYPFDDLVIKLGIDRNNQRNPLFDVMFILQNMEKFEARVEGVRICPADFEINTTQVDLMLYAYEDKGQLGFTLIYSKKLFKKESMERLLKELILIIDMLANDPSVKVEDISIFAHEAGQSRAETVKDKVESLEVDFNF